MSHQPNNIFAGTQVVSLVEVHLLHLLLTGAATLRDARVPVRVEAHRERLLPIKRGDCIARSARPIWAIDLQGLGS